MQVEWVLVSQQFGQTGSLNRTDKSPTFLLIDSMETAGSFVLIIIANIVID